MIFATCASLLLALAGLKGGAIVELRGDCPAMTITRQFEPPVTIEAEAARVAGLTIRGGAGIIWRGGTIEAPAGANGTGPAHYGANVQASRDITFEGVTFTNANKALVVAGSSRVAVRFSKFTALREDGVIASSTAGLTVTHNSFDDFRPAPTTCAIGSSMVLKLARRDCEARAGDWEDASHPDAVQMFNAVNDALIGWNTVTGAAQGLTQMDSPSHAPLARVTIIGNDVAGSYPHSITLDRCIDCAILSNKVRRIGGGKTVIRFNAATTTAKGNSSADGGAGLVAR